MLHFTLDLPNIGPIKNEKLKHLMISKRFISDLMIRDCLKNYYDIDCRAIKPLRIGADLNASTYKIDALDHSSYFIKIKQGTSPEISLEIVELLHEFGLAQIISPVKTSQGKLTQQLNNFTVIVYPFIDGQNGFELSLSNNQWISLGKALKKIHTFKLPPPIQQKIRKETYSNKWRKAVRSIYDHIETDHFGDEIAINLHLFMKEQKAVISQLVNRAELLAKKLQHISLPFVLCHSDIHAGNILVDDKSHLYIVDLDEPILAPKERDLMFIGGGVGNVWNEPSENKLFYKGYSTDEVNDTALAYYRHERIIEDIAIYAHEILQKNPQSINKLEMYNHFLDMFVPGGVVDIAFETFKRL